jgi:hypothetical protein
MLISSAYREYERLSFSQLLARIVSNWNRYAFESTGLVGAPCGKTPPFVHKLLIISAEYGLNPEFLKRSETPAIVIEPK